MTEHLPECPCNDKAAHPDGCLCCEVASPCICDRLRACEERVRSNPDWRSHILLDELERCLALARKEWEVEARPGVVSIADYRSVCKWAYIKGLDDAREAALAVTRNSGKRDMCAAMDALREKMQ